MRYENQDKYRFSSPVKVGVKLVNLVLYDFALACSCKAYWIVFVILVVFLIKSIGLRFERGILLQMALVSQVHVVPSSKDRPSRCIVEDSFLRTYEIHFLFHTDRKEEAFAFFINYPLLLTIATPVIVRKSSDYLSKLSLDDYQKMAFIIALTMESLS